ncbi:ABC transporter ATP-binding protein [Candidatus Bipolaricaulota bacterium]|nr:ABC transporter ATP-binding protein [Candidatus Bipolaricaulota bacterium]
MAMASFEHVVKVFAPGTRREVRAVDDFSLEVERGELVTLLGPSGCGKTTSLRILAGFELPTSGEVYIDGQRMTYVPPQRRPTSMVFQSYGLFPHMTVFQNVAYGLKVRRLPRNEIKRRVAEVLALVGLQGLEDRGVGQLSGGQQQRVALCRAIVVQPKVLLFDEPLSNLDAKLRKGTREQIRRIQKELGITSLYVTHDQAEAMSISDRIAVMNAGRLQQLGTAEEIYSRPANRFVADFIGEANFLSARVLSCGDGRVRIRLLGKEIEVSQSGMAFRPGQEVDVVVRPEAVDILPEGEGDCPAEVLFSHYTGSVVLYALQLPGGERLEVQVANPQERGLLPVGASVEIRLHRKSLHLLPKEP